ncbi:MAG: glycosyltransferase 87 family protein [Actinomycetota bacterium]|nr:glycosyltransferase 87 family protein [Actinomycetota bacterium]
MRRDIALVVAICCVTLIAGFGLKAQCLAAWDGRQFARLCYNDIQPLFYARSIATTVPYIHGSLLHGDLQRGAIEYPVLTGLFMYASGHLAYLFPFLPRANASSGNEYLYDSALLLAPFALLIAVLLGSMTRTRALLWAAAPALVLYAFHNWDLLVVAAAVAGFWSWNRRHTGWAAFWFGIGGALKLYPLMFLAPLILERLRAGDRKGAVKAVLLGVLPPVAINLPFVLVNFPGWFATYAFHATRGADYNSIWLWFMGAHLFGLTLPVFDVGTLNLVTAVLTGAFAVIALVVGWMRARGEDRYPFIQVSGALLSAFLLWNKVHSPQYALWILPFFVLLDVRIWWWFAYAAADLTVYVGIFRWFYDFVYRGMDLTWAKRALILGIWARGAILAALFVVFLYARVTEGVRGGRSEPLPGEVASHPSASVWPVGEQLPARG